jgi:hypothetical protein
VPPVLATVVVDGVVVPVRHGTVVVPCGRHEVHTLHSVARTVDVPCGSKTSFAP